MYTANISFAPFETARAPPVAGGSSNPEIPREGADMKLVYDLATKVSIVPPAPYSTLHRVSDFIEAIARTRQPEHQVEHDVREYR